jgi:hypothetical protein
MFGFIRNGKTKERRFWDWFEEHEQRYYTLQLDSPDLQRAMARVTRQMRKVHPELCCEFALADSGPRTFFLSAGGVKDAFPAVESLYAQAPPLERWKIERYKPRKSGKLKLQVMGRDYCDETVCFHLFEEEGNKVGIHLFFEEYDRRLSKLYATIGFLFLDSLLGEYDVATYLGEITFLSKQETDAQGLQPLRCLPEAFDRWKLKALK